MGKAGFISTMFVCLWSVAFARGQSASTVSVATLRVPAKARAHFERARQAALAGRYQECELENSKALELDRNFADAYALRGSQELFRKDFEAALTDSYLAARLDRGLLSAKLVSAGALMGLRRFGDAWAVLETMGTPEGQGWEVKFERTRAALGLGDVAGALRWSAELLTVAPPGTLDSAKVLRGDALDMADRYAEAVQMWREYLASPRKQVYREQVLAALARDERRSATQEVAGLGR